MSTHSSTTASPARLALSVSDPSSSGIIDINHLRAEPLPLSLSTLSPADRPPPPAASPPQRHRWPRAVLGTALATTLGLFGLVASLPTSPTIIVERPVTLDRQLSMRELKAAPVMTAIDHHDQRPPRSPVAPARGHQIADASAPAASASDTTATSTATDRPKTKRRRSSKRRSARPNAPSALNPASTGDAIPVECVLDPSRCGPTAPRSAPPTDSPEALPAKLSTAQLKAALASVKADARSCGPQHSAPSGARVRIKLSIEGKTGSVLSASAQGEHADAPVGRCVARALGRAQFPRFSAARMGTIYSVRL